MFLGGEEDFSEEMNPPTRFYIKPSLRRESNSAAFSQTTFEPLQMWTLRYGFGWAQNWRVWPPEKRVPNGRFIGKGWYGKLVPKVSIKLAERETKVLEAMATQIRHVGCLL